MCVWLSLSGFQRSLVKDTETIVHALSLSLSLSLSIYLSIYDTLPPHLILRIILTQYVFKYNAIIDNGLSQFTTYRISE